jgi:hypothetical protein
VVVAMDMMHANPGRSMARLLIARGEADVEAGVRYPRYIRLYSAPTSCVSAYITIKRTNPVARAGVHLGLPRYFTCWLPRRPCRGDRQVAFIGLDRRPA